ncbi:ABC transport system permease component YbhS [Salmonella enterica subsp. enterica]|nr:ABC transport system permease component YbhS [Salmonella enterica subsp. enterica]
MRCASKRRARSCAIPSSWLIAVVIPLLLLFIFGYGINLDSSKLRVGILLEQQSQEALDFTHAMTGFTLYRRDH